MSYWQCHVDSVEAVTHDTNLYGVSFPPGSRMQVPVGRHVFVTACVDGNSAS